MTKTLKFRGNMASHGISLLSYLCFLVHHSQGLVDLEPKFFHNGDQKCNCLNNAACSPDGRCPNRHCATNFVGITCQHASIQIALPGFKNDDDDVDDEDEDEDDDGDDKIPKVLMDGKDDTCVDDTFDRRLKFGMEASMFTFWIHIYRKLNRAMSPTFNTKSGSTITYVTSNKSVLIKQKNKGYWLRSFLPLTRLPADTCTVEAGIGRNLALSGNASSGYDEGKSLWKPYKTAPETHDGYEGTNLSRCSLPVPHNETEIGGWRIDLRFEARVNFLTFLVSSIKPCSWRNIIVKTFNKTNDVRFITKKTKNKNKSNKYVVWVNSHLVKSVYMSTPRSKGSQCSDSVALCEVQVFGEFQCPRDTFGELCDKTCPGCSRSTRKNCVPDWGCLRGCGNKKEGQWCEKEIRPQSTTESTTKSLSETTTESNTTPETSLETTTTRTTETPPETTTESTTTTETPLETTTTRTTTPETPIETTTTSTTKTPHVTTTKRNTKAPFETTTESVWPTSPKTPRDTTTTRTASTTPGCKSKTDHVCKYVCSENCAGAGDCNRANGHCLEGCKPGFLQDMCTDICTSGYYGMNCSNVCSRCSTNKTTNEHMCHYVTGQCSQGCATGYMGENCENVTVVSNNIRKKQEAVFYILLFVAFLVALIIYNVAPKIYKKMGKFSTLEQYEEEEEEGEWDHWEDGEDGEYWGEGEEEFIEEEFWDKFIGEKESAGQVYTTDETSEQSYHQEEEEELAEMNVKEDLVEETETDFVGEYEKVFVKKNEKNLAEEDEKNFVEEKKKELVWEDEKYVVEEKKNEFVDKKNKGNTNEEESGSEFIEETDEDTISNVDSNDTSYLDPR